MSWWVGMFNNLTAVNIPQCIHLSNYHIVHLSIYIIFICELCVNKPGKYNGLNGTNSKQAYPSVDNGLNWGIWRHMILFSLISACLKWSVIKFPVFCLFVCLFLIYAIHVFILEIILPNYRTWCKVRSEVSPLSSHPWPEENGHQRAIPGCWCFPHPCSFNGLLNRVSSGPS